MKNQLLLSLLLSSTVTVYAQTEAVRQREFNVKKTLAIEGYDPVSYFDNKPEEGDEDITTVYRGLTYYFVNAGNLARFKANPGKYEPAFGGWCAYAMGESGEKVKIDPETYKILDGKTYLFYNFWGNNTLETWNENEKALKARAEQNWKKFVP